MISNAQRALLAQALIKSGAAWTPVFRQPKDANGVATGDPERIGCLLGRKYRKGSVAATIHIDIPGTIVRTEHDRFEAIPANVCMRIRKGDMLHIAGAWRTILEALEPSAGLYVLILDEEGV